MMMNGQSHAGDDDDVAADEDADEYGHEEHVTVMMRIGADGGGDDDGDVHACTSNIRLQGKITFL